MAEDPQERPETLTHPLAPRWLERPDGYRHFESAYFVGRGRDTFDHCAEELLHWEVKIRSGFDIDVDGSADSTDRASGSSASAKAAHRSPRVERGQELKIGRAHV